MVSDSGSTRYLPAIIYATPFVLAPIAYRIRGSYLVPAMLCFCLISGWGSWLQFSPMTAGLRVVRDPGAWLANAREMADWLRERKVGSAFSDYWVAYQLTFLFEENPIVVPRSEWQDRYEAYRKGVKAAPVVAEIFTPESDFKPSVNEGRHPVEARLRAENALIEKWEKGGFLCLVRKNLLY
jgi:hypothetical protein